MPTRRPVRTFASLFPDWWHGAPDPGHPHRRRYTTKYRRKRRIVRDLWLVAAALMALHPVIQVVVPVALGMTCLSFCILDETD